MDKAAVFIDQGYFSRILEFYGLQKTSELPDGSADFENRLDYTKFSEELCTLNSCERFRTYVYDSLPYQGKPPTVFESSLLSKKQAFKAYLDSSPSFLTRYGLCMKIPNKQCYMYAKGRFEKPCEHIAQKGVDVRFTIDLVSLATDKRVDKAILVTGDSDFIPAINYARDQNMKVILY